MKRFLPVCVVVALAAMPCDAHEMPVSVMARDFCLKVNGSATYRGLQPEEVLAGWLFFYDEWKREPFIQLTGDDVRRAIGVDARYAALADFYDYRGYKVQDCAPTPAVMQAHERTGLISAVCTGSAFKIYPIGGGEWVSWVSARPAEMSLDDWRFVRGSMEFVAREIAHNRHSSAWQALGTMRERQRAMAGAEAPSPLSIPTRTCPHARSPYRTWRCRMGRWQCRRDCRPRP